MNELKRLFGTNFKVRFTRILCIAVVVLCCIQALAPVSVIAWAFLRTLLAGNGQHVFEIWGDSRFLAALFNSVLIGISVAFLLGTLTTFFAAMLFWTDLTGNRIFYAICLIPLLIPDYVFGLTGRMVFDPTIGLLNSVVPDSLLVMRSSSLLLIVGLVVLKWLPPLYVLADLRIQGLSDRLRDQIHLDCGSFFSAFKLILGRRLLPISLLIACFGFLTGFRVQELATELTSGGGGLSGETWPVWNYRVLFEFGKLNDGLIESTIVILVLLVPLTGVMFASRRLA